LHQNLIGKLRPEHGHEHRHSAHKPQSVARKSGDWNRSMDLAKSLMHLQNFKNHCAEHAAHFRVTKKQFTNHAGRRNAAMSKIANWTTTES
jgi:hypothetical protein